MAGRETPVRQTVCFSPSPDCHNGVGRRLPTPVRFQEDFSLSAIPRLDRRTAQGNMVTDSLVVSTARSASSARL